MPRLSREIWGKNVPRLARISLGGRHDEPNIRESNDLHRDWWYMERKINDVAKTRKLVNSGRDISSRERNHSRPDNIFPWGGVGGRCCAPRVTNKGTLRRRVEIITLVNEVYGKDESFPVRFTYLHTSSWETVVLGHINFHGRRILPSMSLNHANYRSVDYNEQMDDFNGKRREIMALFLFLNRSCKILSIRRRESMPLF